MSEEALTQTTVYDDGKFVRTAVILGEGGSIDVVNQEGKRIALLNLFTNDDNSWFAIDVIDKDEIFTKHTALTFKDGNQQRIDDANGLVAADFRKEENSDES